MSFPTEEQIRAALTEVNDPEIGINIVDLGLIYEINTWAAGVEIKMTMTTPACPLREYLKKTCEEAIHAHFPSVGAVLIEFIWEPPWDSARMSGAAKKQLGWSC